MFSRTKSLMKINFYQNVFRTRYIEAVKNEGLEKFLQPLLESPPKQGYSLLFFDAQVQGLLKNLSNIDFEKVFMPKPRGQKLQPARYRLLTDTELQEVRNKYEKVAKYLLQIPPLVNITEDKTEIKDFDTSLDGFDEQHAKYIFTDITLNKDNENRVVYVREPNGILRTASKSERFRVNQIFFPIPGRELETPKMFLPENLMDILQRKEYEFVLDRACAQFEPDDEAYHQVISITYNAINYCKDFEMLQSTRHYGSLAFYLITHKIIDSILAFHIENYGVKNALSLIKLYHIIHPNCKSAQMSHGKNNHEILKEFIEFDSTDKTTLTTVLENVLQKTTQHAEFQGAETEEQGLPNS